MSTDRHTLSGAQVDDLVADCLIALQPALVSAVLRALDGPAQPTTPTLDAAMAVVAKHYSTTPAELAETLGWLCMLNRHYSPESDQAPESLGEPPCDVPATWVGSTRAPTPRAPESA